jgi:integrase
MATLTDAKARNIKAADGTLPHGGIAGLSLHPSTTKGHGKWVMRYVSPVTKKRRNAGMGSYPDVGIAEAGRKAIEFRELLNKGQDPLEIKAELASAHAPTIPTFAEAAEAVFIELEPGWKNVKHKQQWINTVRQYVVPCLGDLPVDTIEPRHVADALRPIWLKIPETAGRVKQRIHSVLAWCWAHGYCKSNPVDVVNHLLPQQPGKAIRVKHQPAMPWVDIPNYIASQVKTDNRFDVSRAMLEFLILTACRSGEVRGMTWSEVCIEKAIWTIPAERMKAQQIHRIPLTQRALEILHQQHGRHPTLVFPSPRDQVPLTDMAITSLLRRTHAHSDVDGRTATAHGFRSSFRDWCSEHGYARDLAERALAHTVHNKVEAAYHRTDLLEKRRPMMEAWEQHVQSKIHN